MTKDYIIKTLNRYTHPSYQPLRYSEEHGKHVPMQDGKVPSNTAHFYDKKDAKDFVDKHRQKQTGYRNLAHKQESREKE